MQVKLIAITKPVVEGMESAQDLLSYCARASNPANQNNFETGAKLLKYCINHKHWSVFEMASLVVEIETTRDIARQILRHKSCAFVEMSQRYAEVPSLEFRECRLQDTKNRQNSLAVEDETLANMWESTQQEVAVFVLDAYRGALASGIAKEVARVLLPEGMSPTRLYVHGSVRSFFHYCQVRTDVSVQKEHREIAQAIQEILFENFPALRE